MSDAIRRLTRTELLRLLEVEDEFLVELERAEILTRHTAGDPYGPEDVERARICRSLRKDLGVNDAGLQVALHLLEQLSKERRQFAQVLRWLHDQLDIR